MTYLTEEEDTDEASIQKDSSSGNEQQDIGTQFGRTSAGVLDALANVEYEDPFLNPQPGTSGQGSNKANKQQEQDSGSCSKSSGWKKRLYQESNLDSSSDDSEGSKKKKY